MKYLEFFAPKGWTITHNPKPIGTRAHDYDFVHEDYDGENGLCGTAGDYLGCTHQIFEIIRDSYLADEVIGKPAPDICLMSVRLTKDGVFEIQENLYTGNRFTELPNITLGLKNGRRDNKLTGLGLSMSYLNRAPQAGGLKSFGYTVVPGMDINAGGWCLADSKQKFIDHCKSAIRAGLSEVLERGHEQLKGIDRPVTSNLADSAEYDSEPGLR